jgi:hypothetical protein
MNKPYIGRLDKRGYWRYVLLPGKAVLRQYRMGVSMPLLRRPHVLRRGIINTSGGPLLGVTLTWRYP